MPAVVTVQLLGVWFCIGFFTGLGWSLANVLVSRIAARFP